MAGVSRGKVILTVIFTAVVGLGVAWSVVAYVENSSSHGNGDDLDKFANQIKAAQRIGSKSESDFENAPKLKSVDRQKTAPTRKVAQGSGDQEKKPDLARQLISLQREYDDKRMLAIKCLETVAAVLPAGVTMEELRFNGGKEVVKNLTMNGFVPGKSEGEIDNFRKALLAVKDDKGASLFANVAFDNITDARAGQDFKRWFINCELNMVRTNTGGLAGKITYSIPAIPHSQLNFDPFIRVRNMKHCNGINPSIPSRRATAAKGRTSSEASGFDSFENHEVHFRFRTGPRELMLFLRELGARSEMIRLNTLNLKPARDRQDFTGDITIIANVLKEKVLVNVPAPPGNKPEKKIPNISLADVDESPLVKENPFGLQPIKIPKPPVLTKAISPMPQIRLTGVLLLRDKKVAYLEIRVPGAAKPIYHQLQEEESAEGVKVIRIESNRIVIKFEATNEERIVTFSEDDPAKARPSSPPKPSPGRPKRIPSVPSRRRS